MKVQRVKRQYKLREWSEQIKSREASGLGVERWCEENGIGKSAYYYRLKRVQEEMLDSLESTSTYQLSGLPVISGSNVPAQQLAFAPVNMTQSKGAAITVWIGANAVDVQNGADVITIEQVLRVVSRL